MVHVNHIYICTDMYKYMCVLTYEYKSISFALQVEFFIGGFAPAFDMEYSDEVRIHSYLYIYTLHPT
jgi:hypothetical protein